MSEEEKGNALARQIEKALRDIAEARAEIEQVRKECVAERRNTERLMRAVFGDPEDAEDLGMKRKLDRLVQKDAMEEARGQVVRRLSNFTGVSSLLTLITLAVLIYGQFGGGGAGP